MEIKIKVLGTPQPKQSARFRIQKFGGKTFVKSYQDDKTVQNEQNFSAVAQTQLPEGFVPFSGPLKVSALFVFPPLKSFSKSKINAISSGAVFYKDSKPDLQDNLFKGIADALTGVVYLDDRQICEVSSRKIYGAVPRTELVIEAL